MITSSGIVVFALWAYLLVGKFLSIEVDINRALLIEGLVSELFPGKGTGVIVHGEVDVMALGAIHEEVGMVEGCHNLSTCKALYVVSIVSIHALDQDIDITVDVVVVSGISVLLVDGTEAL